MIKRQMSLSLKQSDYYEKYKCRFLVYIIYKFQMAKSAFIQSQIQGKHSFPYDYHTFFSAEAETPETPVVQTEPSPRSCRNQVLFFLDVPVCIGLRVNNSCESCAIVMEDDTYPIPAASVNDVQIEPIPKRSKNHCLFLLLIPLIDGSLLRSSQVS